MYAIVSSGEVSAFDPTESLANNVFCQESTDDLRLGQLA